jgi:hypothetical protein
MTGSNDRIEDLTMRWTLKVVVRLVADVDVDVAAEQP